jgi:DNA-binding CsgD family transcriptional regulator
MIDDAALILIDRIYRAVLEPELLPQIVVQISAAVGAVQECIQIRSNGLRSFNMISPRRDPAFLARAHACWADNDVLDGARRFDETIAALPAETVVDMQRIVGSDWFRHSEFYNEWWRPQRLGPAMAIRLSTSDGVTAAHGVHKPPGSDGFSSTESALFHLVAQHLARAIAIGKAFAPLVIERNLRDMAVGRGKGILLVGRAGRLVYADKTAEEWLRNGCGLHLEDGIVTACDADAARMLTRLILSCGDIGIGDAGPGGAFAIPRSDGPPLSVTVAPFRPPENELGRASFGFPRPAAILVVSDPAHEREERKAHLRDRFGLTAAEAELALEILNGDGREAAARRMGISLSTARTHLMRIFDKTGCRRQAEFVRLCLKGDDTQ